MIAGRQELSLIYAVNEVGTIGHAGRIPWWLPSDLERFRRITSGHTVVMGRKTWESLPASRRPLKERLNIILSSTLEKQEGALVARTPEEIIELYHGYGKGNLFIIGGVELYKIFLDKADRIYMTLVDDKFEGDAKFKPELDNRVWKVSSTMTVPTLGDSHAHRFVNLVRRQQGSRLLLKGGAVRREDVWVPRRG